MPAAPVHTVVKTPAVSIFTIRAALLPEVAAEALPLTIQRHIRQLRVGLGAVVLVEL